MKNKTMAEVKLNAAFEVIAAKFKTSELNVSIAYAHKNKNVVSMVDKMTGAIK